MTEAISQKRSTRGVTFKLAGFAEVTGQSIHRLEPCQPRLKIIIAEHDIVVGGLNDVPKMHKAFVVGPSCPPLRSEHNGVLTCVEIELPPWAGIAVFGHPLHDEPLPLSDLIGSLAGELVEHLSQATDWKRRLALVESFVTSRIAESAERISPEIRWAWERLECCSERISIRALADEIGWSGRHFGRRFAEETGILPKSAMRMMRFDQAIRLMERPDESLAEIAYACGYADQSHMTREFVEYAARSPDAHRKARLSDLPGTSAQTAET